MEADPSDVIRSPGPWPERAGYDPAAQMTVNPAEYVTELFRAHHLELVRLAVLIVGDLATAEDVVQDAFEQLHRRWRTLRKQSSALDYARSAVLNGSRSVLRRRSVARRHAARISASSHQDADAAARFRAAQRAHRGVPQAARQAARGTRPALLRGHERGRRSGHAAHQRRRRPLDRLPWPRCAGPDPPVPFLEGGVRHA